MATRTAATVQKEIDNYQALIADASVPQDEKDFAESEIPTLKRELEKLQKGGKPKSGKPAKSATGKSKAKSSIEECEEVVSKARAEKRAANPPVQHNKATRFDNAMSTVSNVLMEGQEDEKIIKSIETKVTSFITSCKEEFLDLKNTEPTPELIKKFENKIENVK